MSYRAVVLDIEGTTTPIQFVYEILFPYARQHLRSYLEQHPDPYDLQAFRDQALADRSAGLEVPLIPAGSGPNVVAAVVQSALSQMDKDRKVGALKALQGKIWEHGYRCGELRGQIFPDVVPALQRWREAKIPVYIYSSGSVLAQQLLFGHSEAGDLRNLLAGYFDTAVGAKRESSSYLEIARQIGIEPSDCLFATDIQAEAAAAAQAGWRAVVVNRPGNSPQPDHNFAVVTDFATL